jgi:fructose/tagatose bisphosphate aldolase
MNLDTDLQWAFGTAFAYEAKNRELWGQTETLRPDREQKYYDPRVWLSNGGVLTALNRFL